MLTQYRRPPLGLTLAELAATERALDIVRRHNEFLGRCVATLTTLLLAHDVLVYPRLYERERARAMRLLQAIGPAPSPQSPTEDATQYLSRLLVQTTATLNIWALELLPLLIDNNAPWLRPPLQQLRAEACALLDETARLLAPEREEAPHG